MKLRFVCSILCILPAGCSEPPKTPKQTISISIAHGTELREMFGELRSQYYRLAPPLSNGRQVTIQLLSQHPAAVAKSLHDKEDHADAWISPHPLFIHYNNSIANGHRFSNCTPLFETALVAVGTASLLKSMQDADGRVSITQILESSSSSTPIQSLLLSDPIDAATGWASLEYMASLQSLRNPEDSFQIQEILSRWQRAVSDYSESERTLIDAPLHSNNRPVLTLTTRQQYLKFNQSSQSLYRELNPIGTQFAYQLCTAGDLSETKREAFSQLLTFLKTELARDIISKFKFDLPQQTNSTHLNPPPEQTDVDVGKTAKLFFTLLSKWHEIQKPSYKIIVLDASASLQGGPFASIKESLKMAIAETSLRSQHSLISFNSDVALLTPRTSDRLHVLSELDRITPSGGSAVYDGILKGIEQLSLVPGSDARRLLFIITDGDDKNSHSNLLDVLAALSQKTLQDHFRCVIIALRTSPESSFEDLKQIAKAADGIFIETTPLYAGPVLKDLLKTMD